MNELQSQDQEADEQPDLPNGQFTVQLCTGRSAVIRELNGLEQTQVDEMVDYEKLTGLPNYRVAACLVSLGEQKFKPAATAMSLRSRLQKLTGRELEQLKRAHNREFGLPDDEESLKKQSTDDEG